MPPVPPDSLARLLSLLRGGFTAPTFDTFCWLVRGFIGRIGEHTVTGIWQAARLGGVFTIRACARLLRAAAMVA